MRNLLVLLPFTLIVLNADVASAQPAKLREIRQVNPISKEVYVFPHFTIPGKKESSININNHLRSEMLGTEPGTAEKEIFDGVWKKDDFLPSLQGIDYSITRNDKIVLSLQISAEGCGAYCEPFTSYFNFNPSTGNVLVLDNLFTPIGIQRLSDSATHYIRQLMELKIREAYDSLRETSDDEEMKEYYKQMIDLYSECSTQGSYGIMSKFSLEGTKLTMYGDRCSAHYNRNLDELGNFEYSIQLDNWKQYLTEYGRKLVVSGTRVKGKK